MGLRLRKSFTICKGVKVDLGKNGPSVSFGTGGLRQIINLNGKKSASSAPGAGIPYATNPSLNKISPEVVISEPKGFSKDNRIAVQEYDRMIETIRGIHKYADDEIDWNIVYNSPEPFNINAIGPKGKLAKEKLNSYEPSVSEKILKFKLDKKLNEFKADVKRSMQEDEELYDGWRNLVDLAGKIMQGDIDSYFEVINEMKPLDDLLEFGIDFEFGANSSDKMHVEFIINYKDIVPYFELSLTQNGKLSKRNLTKTEYYKLVKDYISSSAIRIARDMFALLPVEKTVVHIVEDYLDTQTGDREKITVLSVEFDRQKLNSLNLDSIDPSDAINNFKHNIKFLKMAGLKEVERI
ncbi:MAG: DUF4236 domain-containing protein [Proteocatella sp.]